MSRVSLVWRRPSWKVASAVPGLDQAHPIGGEADIELFPDGIAVSALRPATPRPRSPSPVRSQPRAPVQPPSPLWPGRTRRASPGGPGSRRGHQPTSPAIRAEQPTLASSGVHAARHRPGSRLSSADPSARPAAHLVGIRALGAGTASSAEMGSGPHRAPGSGRRTRPAST